MRIGELRHRITIQKATTIQDELGQPVEVWQDIANVWAKIEDISGREYFAAKQVLTNEITTKITIRWRNDIEPSMRIVAEGRIFDIQTDIDPDGCKHQLQLMCKEVV
ncbi:phage head closure protein [Thermoanaerobacterium thermosaccharolyticum]|uniref:phage head closure protein n=1 Tax=Thermoanaerobacterium thermosaccharolyticum TaxID=1517 RepID=UPI003D2BB3BC